MMIFGAVPIYRVNSARLCAGMWLSALLASLCGCEILGLGQVGEAWVDVDPTLARTIQHFGDLPDEVTQLAEADIECLHAEPQSCSIREEIFATVHNTGSGVVWYHEQCGGALERWTDGNWWVDRGVACITLPMHEIPEASSRLFPLPVYGLDVGRYRVHLRLTRDLEELPEDMTVSQAFVWP